MVVGLNALGAGRAYGGGPAAAYYPNVYIGIGALMNPRWQFALPSGAWRPGTNGVLAIEGELLAEFMVFWLVQRGNCGATQRATHPPYPNRADGVDGVGRWRPALVEQ